MIYLIFILAITIGFVSGSEIDNLKTNKEVNKFLTENVLKDSHTTVLDESKTNTSKYGKNKFYKLDLNNDGLTDLIVDGEYFFAVIDKGNKKYEIHPIDRGAFSLDKYTLTNITYLDRTPLFVIRKYKTVFVNPDLEEHRIGGKETEKTLILKFGNFIEYNSKPDNFKIEEIKFSTSGCFGSCPVFEIVIDRNKNAIYKAIEYNDDDDGKFSGTIDSDSYDKLIQTINYINTSNLKNEYSVQWTDDQTASLEIKFDNGKTKKISDYGLIGTFGLENLYSQLLILRKTQKWTKQPEK